jgi:pimeloyl-ACP methyl ester carboxylesterase
MTRILFLPGSGASPDFWKPVAALLPPAWPKEFFGWPGLSAQPHDPTIKGLDDLIAMVVARMTEPVDLVAQSMGGGIAARIALAHPRLLRRLVLTATSSGVDMMAFGASGAWREDYRRSYPNGATWILEPSAAAPLPVERIAARTLLLWGDDDEISPLAVGQHLAQRLPDARLHVVKGGRHDLAKTHAAEIAPLIERHLAQD